MRAIGTPGMEEKTPEASATTPGAAGTPEASEMTLGVAMKASGESADLTGTEREILEEVERLRKPMLDAIGRVVRIDSVESEALPGAPFGEGVRKALDMALEISRELGFLTRDLDHYIGYAEYHGEDGAPGRGYACAIGHLDVVPVGEGWKHPPFSAYQEDGVIYSRGILDNKGPVMACLYGLYAIKRLGIRTRRPVRIIFGCDEETGFLDLERYLEREEPPAYGFTPDCKYPAVYGERGRAVVQVRSRMEGLEPFFAFVNQYFIGAKNNGDRLGIDFGDDEFGTMEMRGYSLGTDAGAVTFDVTLSYPAGVAAQELLERIRQKAGDMEVRLLKNYDPVRFDKDSPMVRRLSHCYEAVTGLDGAPVTTTGGTYAKAMPGIIPFGPSFPGQKGIGHNPNEWMAVEDLMANAKIYALALYHLGNL